MTAARTVPDEVVKELNVHGVSIVEVKRTGNVVVQAASAFNRRVTTFDGDDHVGAGARRR